jgi:hypothetical protein
VSALSPADDLRLPAVQQSSWRVEPADGTADPTHFRLRNYGTGNYIVDAAGKPVEFEYEVR